MTATVRTSHTDGSTLDPDEIDFGLIAEHITAMLPGVRVEYGQSGGNCATIYVGAHYYLRHDGTISHDEADAADSDWLTPVLAGPGWIDSRRWGGVGHVDEFSVGYDGNDPDPDINSVNHWQWVDGHGERMIAQFMVRLYRNHPRIAS